MKGWILDVYPNLKKGKMVLWLRTEKRCYKSLENYNPVFYLRALNGDFSRASKIYEDMGFKIEKEMRTTSLHENGKKELLKISPGKTFNPQKQAGALDFFEGYKNYRFYNVDIPLDQRFLIEKNITPVSLVEKEDGWERLEGKIDETINYPLPPLRVLELGAEIESEGVPKKEDVLSKIKIGEEKIKGSESEILKDLNKRIKRKDPDIIITEGGDAFLIPYLKHRAELHEVELTLGREPSLHMFKEGSIYESYGRVIYKPSSSFLKGRIHVDKSNSFLYNCGGSEGLIEVSRLSKIPLQRLSRRSPGALINAMEIEQALKDGYLIPWKKNITENFKSLTQLIRSDRGGHIFEPKVGFIEDVLKVDFASMYPSIIDKYNLSPETLDCEDGDYNTVPELGYRVCKNPRGLIPKVVAPLIERRQKYKKLLEKNEIYSRRAEVLKWLLVTCFGYTGYKKARFSNIEVHESITAYGREILLAAADVAQDMGYELIHGIVDSLWLKGDENKLEKYIEKVNKKTNIILEYEGRYRWIVFLPSKKSKKIGVANRYYGKLDGKIEAKGMHCRRKDTPVFFKKLQRTILEEMCKYESKKEIEDNFHSIIDIIKRASNKIRIGEVSIEELYFKKSVSKEASAYKNMTEQKAALLQYNDIDINVHPGELIKYIVRNQDSKDYREKIRVEYLPKKDYDRRYYEKYLYSIIEEILIPFGYDEKKIEKEIKHL
ncbi:MAG: DNA polymerase domain-containing protein [Thermoplasmatota archaeon]